MSKLKYSPYRVATMYNEQSLHKTVTHKKTARLPTEHTTILKNCGIKKNQQKI
jgi:hypothetical protein